MRSRLGDVFLQILQELEAFPIPFLGGQGESTVEHVAQRLSLVEAFCFLGWHIDDQVH